MECIENMVKDIYECCKIPFQLSIESLGDYETSEYDDSDQIISKNIKFNGTKCCLKTKAAFGREKYRKRCNFGSMAYSFRQVLFNRYIHRK